MGVGQSAQSGSEVIVVLIVGGESRHIWVRRPSHEASIHWQSILSLAVLMPGV